MATAVKLLFPWQARYSVGISEIDEQHKRLIALINDLHAAMLRGEGKAALERTLDELVRYAATHFGFEENLLRLRGYSELTAHQEEHRRLTAQVRTLKANFQTGKVTITV